MVSKRLIWWFQHKDLFGKGKWERRDVWIERSDEEKQRRCCSQDVLLLASLGSYLSLSIQNWELLKSTTMIPKGIADSTFLNDIRESCFHSPIRFFHLQKSTLLSSCYSLPSSSTFGWKIFVVNLTFGDLKGYSTGNSTSICAVEKGLRLERWGTEEVSFPSRFSRAFDEWPSRASLLSKDFYSHIEGTASIWTWSLIEPKSWKKLVEDRRAELLKRISADSQAVRIKWEE